MKLSLKQAFSDRHFDETLTILFNLIRNLGQIRSSSM